MEPTPFPIRGDMILLQALLKLLGEIGNGGEIKSFLAEGTVRVNDEVETRRGRKLRDGDVVTLSGGRRFRVVAEVD